MALLRLFSSCDKQGVLLSSGVWTFHCGGFSRCSSWPPEYRLSSCGTGFGYSKCGIFSESGTEPMTPALAGRFFTTEPPEKPPK